MKYGSLIALLVVVIIAGSLIHRSSAQTPVATCDSLLANPPPELISVQDIYSLLRALDDLTCEGVTSERFDDFIQLTQTNIVSIALLEERLAPQRDRRSPRLIANFVESYEQTQAVLDVNALLILVDIAYYPCGGDETCVGERIASYTGNRALSGPSTCVFGQSQSCDVDDLPVPIYNQATLERAPDPDASTSSRAQFFCGRYLDCEQ